ncbi:MAG: superoxide dismutase family protein [Acidimicrobiia bacterium]|nr:superoxide dismutase family protein [Acidimicrobiia bacterium]
MTLHRLLSLPLLVASTLILTASGVTSQQDDADETDAGSPLTATAHLVGPDGRAVGTVTLIEGPNGVLVQADVTGLSPGGHGFHIHAVGACEPDFSAAGDHFNPEGIGHGFTVEGGWHAGDLPNIYAAADGTARADFFTAAVTLTPGAENSIFDADGSAIIVHAKPDSYGESPGAGDRVACGVIRPDEPAGSGAAAEDGPADSGDSDMTVPGAAEAGPSEDLPAG